MAESGGRLSPPKKSSIDDIINHITADLQSYDGQYIVVGQRPPSQQNQAPPHPPPSHLWQSSSSDMNPIQQPPIFKPQQQQVPPPQHGMYYNTPPGHQDNYMSYSNMPHYQQNSFLQHQQPLMRDYGLFANHSDQMHNTYPGHQLIDNLVRDWVPNQSGTYSPFGNPAPMNNYSVEKEERPERPVFSDMPRQESLMGARKPRIVAEVRPMRPSYSAVLTKSPPLPTHNNKSSGKIMQPIGAKGENASKTKGKGKKTEMDSKANPGSTLKRQHSSGSGEDGKSSGIQQATNKGSNPLASWSSLEGNATNVTNGGEEYGVGEEGEGKFSRKESGRRSKRNKNNKYHGLNEEEDENEDEEDDDDEEEGNKGGGVGVGGGGKQGKRGGGQQSGGGGMNVQWGVRETESSVHHRATDKKNRVGGGEGGKGGGGKGGEGGVMGKQGGRKKESGGGNKSKARPKRQNGHAHMIGVMVRQWQAECSRLAVLFAAWFFNLVWDIVAMSSGLMVYLFGLLMECVRFWVVSVRLKLSSLLHKKWWSVSFPWRKKRPKLAKNISLPSTGDEAIRRLLSCKEKDPYSILGVAQDCTDDDIKKYYRRQAILVHPDKNQQAGAEEAFKTLAHAFDLIGEPETRAAYDRRVTESTQAEQAWSELNELLSKLSQKVEIATNTIRCTHCGGRHRRILMDRPSYAARFCAQCKIHHSAREGDIWAESWGLGLLWHYYACMETSVYDITEWAACQAVNLKHLKANSHSVQYRIVVGKQHPPPSSSPSHHSHHPHCPNGSSDPDIEDFLNTLYQSSSGGAGGTLCSEHSLHQHSHLHHSHAPRNRRKQGKKKK
ncbi:hypothetical protein WDU94_004605 [Cyamophila willieti]